MHKCSAPGITLAKANRPQVHFNSWSIVVASLLANANLTQVNLRQTSLRYTRMIADEKYKNTKNATRYLCHTVRFNQSIFE